MANGSNEDRIARIVFDEVVRELDMSPPECNMENEESSRPNGTIQESRSALRGRRAGSPSQPPVASSGEFASRVRHLTLRSSSSRSSTPDGSSSVSAIAAISSA